MDNIWAVGKLCVHCRERFHCTSNNASQARGQTSRMCYASFPVEMMVFVSPTRLEVEEGTSVSLHCLVLTDLPANTSINWQMNSEQVKTSLS